MSSTSIWQDVESFHKAFGHPIGDKPIDLEYLPKLVQAYLRKAQEDLKYVSKVLSKVTFEEEDAVKKLRVLRITLLLEEFAEYLEAEENNDIIGIAGELADVHYVAAGASIAYGINGQGVFSEIQRANMDKLDENGKPIYREDGKVLKPEGWKPAQLDKVIRKEK